MAAAFMKSERDGQTGRIRSFDISPDGNVVFDRLRGNSHVLLIDLPGDSQKP
jgi:hypothetical protein